MHKNKKLRNMMACCVGAGPMSFFFLVGLPKSPRKCGREARTTRQHFLALTPEQFLFSPLLVTLLLLERARKNPSHRDYRVATLSFVASFLFSYQKPKKKERNDDNSA
nr:hypothetical protein [Pandoravirus aubagnensis]